MGRKRKKTKTVQSLVDVVICCGGRFDMLRKCISALEAQENAPPFSVYIIDNNTENRERLHHKDIFDNPLITRSKRLTQDTGFPAANNEGARMGSSPLILFLNDDVELFPDALSILVNEMDNPDVGIVGAKLMFPLDSTRAHAPAGKVQHVGLGMTITGDIVHPLVGWKADNPKCCVTRDVIGVTGACLLVRRNLFRQAGEFDLDYTIGTYEDISLCISVQRLGKKVVINADAQGYHHTGATVEKKQKPYPLQQNNMIFKSKWAQSGLFRWTDYHFL